MLQGLREFVRRQGAMTTVMLLAAGHGMRLRPLTDDCPKPLVPVGDRSIIAHRIEMLRGQLGSFDLVVNAHHLAEQVVQYLKEYQPSAQVIVESNLRGTAGGIFGARHLLGEGPVLVINADVISGTNCLKLLSIASKGGLVLSVVARPLGQGTLGMDDKGSVVRLRGEIFGREATGGDYVGIAALGHEVLDSVPAQGCLIGDWAMPTLRSGGQIRALIDAAAWTDIGSPQAYVKANQDWLETQGMQSWVASGASVAAGTKLANTIVGQGAQVTTIGLLERVIIWPYAHLDKPLADAVVTRSGRVVPVPRG